MISFSCHHCGQRFSLPDHHAGRRGTCKQCGTSVVVPATAAGQSSKIVINLPPTSVSTPRTPPAPPLKTPVLPSGEKRGSVRTRRLMADAAQVQAAFRRSERIQILATFGDPPETYHLQYNVQGLKRDAQGQPVPSGKHVVEIQLTLDYPRQSPKCKMLTPIFHPNIEPAMICIGDHWTAGERLVDLMVRIGEMITYQAYNIKSPLDGEAAMWADLNAHRLPIDNSPLQAADPG